MKVAQSCPTFVTPCEPTGNLDSDNAVKAMELLTNKLNELEGSSAIIVSHDMHLAVTFADIIIKIRKQESTVAGVKDEVAYYGVIDNERNKSFRSGVGRVLSKSEK